MNPELELYLQQAFSAVRPTSSAIGRVIVEPDYEASWNSADAVPLAAELTTLLSAPSLQQGELKIPAQCSLLTKYLRRIMLQTERVENAWVEIEPPGNWI